MKYYLSLIIALFVLSGCSDNLGIVELSDNSGIVEFVTTNDYLRDERLQAKIIEGNEGGEIDFDIKCVSSNAIGILEFPEFCFADQEQVSICVPSTEKYCAIVDITPHKLILDKPVFLTLKFTGMNFMKGDIVDFKMMNNEGELTDVDYGRLIIDYDNHWALVIDAKIYQFSKFGFTTVVN